MRQVRVQSAHEKSQQIDPGIFASLSITELVGTSTRARSLNLRSDASAQNKLLEHLEVSIRLVAMRSVSRTFEHLEPDMLARNRRRDVLRIGQRRHPIA